MNKVTCDRICLIYSLICDDIDLNIGVVIFWAMRKARLYIGCSYGFGGLLTQFIKVHGVEEEHLDYRSEVNT